MVKANKVQSQHIWRSILLINSKISVEDENDGWSLFVILLQMIKLFCMQSDPLNQMPLEFQPIHNPQKTNYFDFIILKSIKY